MAAVMTIKKMTQLEQMKRIRRTWDIDPVTRIKQSKKGYSRKQKHKEDLF